MNPDRTIAPPVSPSSSAPLPPAAQYVLDNGMTLIAYHRPELELMAFNAVTRGGEAEADNPATASLAAALRTEGIPSLSSAQIADIIDSSGSWNHSSAQPHHTTTGIFALERKAASVIPLLCDMVFCPTFPQNELDIAAQRLAAKVAVKSSTVEYQSQTKSKKIIFGEGHPMARHSSPEDILAVTRADIEAFHARFINPADTTLFATGNITDKLLNIINNSFGAVKGAPNLSPLNIVPLHFPHNGLRSNVEVKDATQCAVNITLPGIPRSDSRYLTLRLAIMALGGYFGSRLSQNIREDKGMTYGISAALLGYDEGGLVQISTRCSASYVDAVIDESLKEVTRLAEFPLSDEELLCVKQAENAALTEVTDSPFATIDFYRTIHTGNLGQSYFDQRRKTVNTLTTNAIAEVAAECLDTSRAVTVVAG